MSDVLFVRGVDKATKATLKAKAKANGRSLTKEVNALLCEAACSADRAGYSSPAHQAISNAAIRRALDAIRTAPAGVSKADLEKAFYNLMTGYHLAVMDAADNGAGVDEIAEAIGADVQGAYFSENPEQPTRTAVFAADNSYNPATGLSWDTVDRT
jgi:hypothetical protein